MPRSPRRPTDGARPARNAVHNPITEVVPAEHGRGGALWMPTASPRAAAQLELAVGQSQPSGNVQRIVPAKVGLPPGMRTGKVRIPGARRTEFRIFPRLPGSAKPLPDRMPCRRNPLHFNTITRIRVQSDLLVPPQIHSRRV